MHVWLDAVLTCGAQFSAAYLITRAGHTRHEAAFAWLDTGVCQRLMSARCSFFCPVWHKQLMHSLQESFSGTLALFHYASGVRSARGLSLGSLRVHALAHV